MDKRKNIATDELTGGPIRHGYEQPIRDQKVLMDMRQKLNRVTGRLEGVKKMLDDNRYCSDILIQVAAAQSILRQFEYTILADHLKYCAVPALGEGKEEVLDELEILIKTIR